MKRHTLTALTLASLIALIGCDQGESPEGAGTEQSGSTQPMDNAAAPEGEAHTTSGTVTAVDQSAARVTVDHEPVPSMEWPAMTMQFKVADPELLSDVEDGDEIRFVFMQDDKGGYVIQDLNQQ